MTIKWNTLCEHKEWVPSIMDPRFRQCKKCRIPEPPAYEEHAVEAFVMPEIVYFPNNLYDYRLASVDGQGKYHIFSRVGPALCNVALYVDGHMQDASKVEGKKVCLRCAQAWVKKYGRYALGTPQGKLD